MSTPAHFNKGIVWGKVVSATEDKMKDSRSEDPEKKLVCCNLQLSCINDFGKVQVFGKIMQEEPAKRFLAEKNTGKTLRLEGVFSQYKHRDGAMKSNYNFFEWNLCPSKDLTDLRAVFILVGRVDDIRYSPEGEPVIVLTTETTKGSRSYKNTFNLAIDDGQEKYFRGGEVYRVKGALRGIEDQFGDTTSIRPLILEFGLAQAVPQGVPVPAGDGEGPIPFD
ncbi:MAG TPA: hypothetical protein DCS42_00415 [Nitrospiraceae bacterium]|nr:hypothetical protein [Nitrospiraceae bacterium]